MFCLFSVYLHFLNLGKNNLYFITSNNNYFITRDKQVSSTMFFRLCLSVSNLICDDLVIILQLSSLIQKGKTYIDFFVWKMDIWNEYVHNIFELIDGNNVI